MDFVDKEQLVELKDRINDELRKDVKYTFW